MRCPNCDKTIGKSSSFCPYCGEDLRYDSHGGAEANDNSPEYREPGPQFPKLNWLDLAEELTHGQHVIVAARWILVGAGLLLALWNPEAMPELRVQIAMILGLAMANFFLHSRLLMGKPVPPAVAYGATAVDIAVISVLVIADGGLASGLYVFYFPALLALSVAFRTEVTAVFAASAIGIYGVVGLPGVVVAEDGAALVTRMLMLAAVAVCGNVYWRVERDRRSAAAEELEATPEQVQEAVAAV
jgi:hypothetical protein